MTVRSKRTFVILAALIAFGVCCASLAIVARWRSQQGNGDWLDGLPGVQSGDTLYLYGGEPETLDPALVQDTTSAGYVIEIFSGLVTLDQDLRVIPDIAKSWDISDQGTRYTFHLRAQVRFHDGKSVHADDFKYAIERACDPKLQSSVALLYLGDIVGAKAFINGQADHIEGIRVVDSRTLEIEIDQPKSYFLSKLTYPTAFVVDRESLGASGEILEPNGTGPYKLTTFEEDLVELERNAMYYRDAAKVERVRYSIGGGIPDTMYENDQLDIAQVGLLNIERVRDPANPLSQQLQVAPGLHLQYIGFNVEMPPFDDPKIRQAFARAIDREKISRVVLKGMAIPAQGVLPPEMPGYDPDFDGLFYDPALAKRLVAESSYGTVANFPELVLHVAGDVTGLPRSIEALLAMWEEALSVQVTVEAVDWPTYLAELNARRYPMFLVGWLADYPDPHNFLDLLFFSESDANHGGYANPQVDQLLKQARIETDRDKRLQLYQQAQEIIVREAACITLWHNRDYFLVKPNVRGVNRSATLYPWLKDVSLEK
jgi:ABC-type transport system substrate-binding protein